MLWREVEGINEVMNIMGLIRHPALSPRKVCSCNCILVFRSSDKRMQERVGLKVTGNHENENETRLLEIKHIRKKASILSSLQESVRVAFLIISGNTNWVFGG